MEQGSQQHRAGKLRAQGDIAAFWVVGAESQEATMMPPSERELVEPRSEAPEDRLLESLVVDQREV